MCVPGRVVVPQGPGQVGGRPVSRPAEVLSACPPLPRLGAHVSTAGGLALVPGRVRHLGAEAVQVFPSNPRQWPRRLPDRAETASLGAAVQVPLFAHAIYLVNLATPDPALAEKSAAALAHAWAFGAWAGARGVVVHPGVRRGEAAELAEARVALVVVRAQALAAEAGAEGPLPPLLVETGAGSRNGLGSSPEALGRLLALLPTPAGVCLDTAHAFAAGHPVHTAEGLETFLAELDRSVGLGAVGLVHLNDSRTPLGSGADRHENVGEGLLGRAGLAAWLGRPELREVPFVLETPGFRGQGPDLRNLRRARLLRARAAQGAEVGSSGA